MRISRFNSTLFILIIFVLSSCNQFSKKDSPSKRSYPKYARGFYVTEENGYKEAFVTNPWDTTKILAHYVFISKSITENPIPKNAIAIKVPCHSVACLSTPEIGFISRLGLVDRITGVSEKDYIQDTVLLNQLASNKTIDLGPFEAYNVELLMELNPEVLFAAPFKEQKYGKIIQTGIPIAYCSSYMEDTPLGRAEWIKFIALFFDKYEEACRLFDVIEKNYLQASKLANSSKVKPTVFSGKMYQNIWYISGLNSYMAQFFIDAGSQYKWQDLSFSGSEPIGFERVYERCYDSDYWVMLEYAPFGYSYCQVASENEKYKDFYAFKNKKIVFCNTKDTPYYEKGIVEPDVILTDFVKIFHPEIIPNYKPTYFKLLGNEN